MFERSVSSILGATLAFFSLVGCSGADGEAAAGSDPELESAGSVELMLSAVPSDATCLQVKIVGSRTVSKSFDLAPKTTPKLALGGLPVGIVKVDASAFASPCSKLEPSRAPSWVLEKPLTARIDSLEVTKLLLKLVRNGRGEATVDWEAPPWLSTSTQPLDLAIIGDTPYGAAQIEDFPNLLAAIGADARISTVVHVGDIKNGSSRCDDAYFSQIFAGFSSLPIPLVYTPGDNEWTDCHRANNGAYDPLERLEALRKVFYPVPGLALGGGFKQVLTQAEDAGFEKFVENQLWFDASVAFGVVHVVGSNDSTPAWYADDTTGTKVDDPARRNAERAERNAANLLWLDRLFDVAVGQNAAGVVISMQADMFDAYSVANNVPLDAFDGIVQKLAARAKTFGKPVLLLEGDSHQFIADKPLENGNPLHGVSISVPNLTRIVVQGSTTTPRTEWLRLHVDPSTRDVFTWERNAR
jgi:hypothetical protein